MLRLNVRFLFVAAFMVALVMLLAISLEIVRFVDLYKIPNSASLDAANFGMAVLGACFFLVLSGYFFVFVLSLVLFTWKASKGLRMLISSLLFIASYAWFFWLLGDGLEPVSISLFFAGLASVLISDVIADALVLRVTK